MLKLVDFPFRPSDAQASIHVLAVPYLFWPARTDDGADVSVYVRLSALEEVLGIVGDHPDRDPRDILRESLLTHRRRIEEAANRLHAAGATGKVFLEFERPPMMLSLLNTSWRVVDDRHRVIANRSRTGTSSARP